MEKCLNNRSRRLRPDFVVLGREDLASAVGNNLHEPRIQFSIRRKGLKLLNNRERIALQ